MLEEFDKFGTVIAELFTFGYTRDPANKRKYFRQRKILNDFNRYQREKIMQGEPIPPSSFEKFERLMRETEEESEEKGWGDFFSLDADKKDEEGGEGRWDDYLSGKAEGPTKKPKKKKLSTPLRTPLEDHLVPGIMGGGV